MSHYTVLGVPVSASPVEIRAAYRRLAMKFHPDRHNTAAAKSSAEIHFKNLQTAYAVLGDDGARRRYDQHIGTAQSWNREQESPEAAPSTQAQSPGYSSRDPRESLPRGRDVKWKTTIPLSVALDGGEVMYRPKSRGRAPGRSVRLRMPAGVVDGSQIVARGIGSPSTLGGLPGDLHITVAIKAQAGFKFAGADLHGQVKVPFSTAYLGGFVTITLPHGPTVDVSVPAGTNSGAKLRLPNMGMRERSGLKGELILTVAITLPRSKRKLSAAEAFLLRSLCE